MFIDFIQLPDICQSFIYNIFVCKYRENISPGIVGLVEQGDCDGLITQVGINFLPEIILLDFYWK